MSSAKDALRGYLIAIEGLDGSGKTTVAEYMVKVLSNAGYRVIYTYEPYHRVFIEILNSVGEQLGAFFEALVMAADRYYHIKDVIEPALNSGAIVITDRYFYSSLAYQGAKGADLGWIRELNKFIIPPDLAIYLDIDPRVGLQRKAGKPSRVEYLQSSLEVLKKAREIYLQMVKEGELIYVDASLTLVNVLRKCIKLLCIKLGIHCLGEDDAQ
ncbi:MAG: dTMP kinase [Desulfurococcales archaeon]|nr:dTMP kinase [Desulfurococcales archaeon]